MTRGVLARDGCLTGRVATVLSGEACWERDRKNERERERERGKGGHRRERGWSSGGEREHLLSGALHFKGFTQCVARQPCVSLPPPESNTDYHSIIMHEKEFCFHRISYWALISSSNWGFICECLNTYILRIYGLWVSFCGAELQYRLESWAILLSTS